MKIRSLKFDAPSKFFVASLILFNLTIVPFSKEQRGILASLGLSIHLYDADKKTMNYDNPSHIKMVHLGFESNRLFDKELKRILGDLSPDFLNNIKSLDISGNGFKVFPDLTGLNNVEYLDIRGNNFQKSPDLSGFKNLKKLDLGIWAFKHFPDLQKLENFEEVYIEGYKLTKDLQGNYYPGYPCISVDDFISILEKIAGLTSEELVGKRYELGKKTYTWAKYLSLIDTLAIYFNDTLLKELRSIYNPVGPNDDLSKIPTITKKLEIQGRENVNVSSEIQKIDTDMIKIVDAQDTVEARKAEEQEFIDALKNKVIKFFEISNKQEETSESVFGEKDDEQIRKNAQLEEEKQRVLKNFREDMIRYIRWLIQTHIGPIGLNKQFFKGIRILKREFASPLEYRDTSAAVINEAPITVVYSEFQLMRFLAEDNVYIHLVEEILGHEIAGHFRDGIIYTIIKLRLDEDRFPIDSIQREKINSIVSLYNVDTHEQEFNADVQGFLSMQNKEDAILLLESLSQNTAIKRAFLYTDFTKIRNKLIDLLKKRLKLSAE